MSTRRPAAPKPRRRPAPQATAPTLAELRARARALGIAGYSRLRKAELESALAAHAAGSAPPAAGAPAPAAAPAAAPSAAAAPAPFHEDIERLPVARHAQLGLLAQRPGVVQAYWVLPPELGGSLPPLALRLLSAEGAVIGELALAAGQGRHYFRIPDDIDPGTVSLQLGYYDAGRQFIDALGPRRAQVPSLYTVSDDPRYRALYLASGGFEHGRRLGWNASISSPAAPFSAPSSPPFNR